MFGRLDKVADGRVHEPINAFSDVSPVKHQISINRPSYQQDQFDQAFGYVPDTRSILFRAIRLVKKTCSPSRNCLQSDIIRFFPILRWLPRYKIRQYLLSDVVAGLTVGIMHIPQGMGYASLAGLPPVFGLYSSFYPGLVYLLMGTSNHMAPGTIALPSLMVGTVLYHWIPEKEEGLDTSLLLKNDTATAIGSANSTYISSMISTTFVTPNDGNDLTPIVVVTALTCLVGFIQLIMGFLRFGFLSVYLSDQLVTGFSVGSAVMILTTQIDKVLGVKIPRYSGIGKLYYTYRDLALALPRTNVATFVTSVICMIAIYVVKEYINERYKKRMKMPVPIDLLVIILATMASYFGEFQQKFSMPIIGKIPTGLPAPTVPRFSIMSGMVGDAFSLAIVVFAISVTTTRIFAKRNNYKIFPNQEMYASAVTCLVLSFFSGWPSGPSLARSSVNESCGSKSPISDLVACAVVLIVLLLVGPLFQYLPSCVLASIIIVALKGMFMQFRELPQLWRISPFDFAIWVVAFLATCILDITLGLAFSVMFAVLTVVLRSQWPHIAMEGRIPNTELFKHVKFYKRIEEWSDVKIFRFDAPLYYGNADSFRDRLYIMCNVDLETIHREMHRLGHGLEANSLAKRASIVKDVQNHAVSAGWRHPVSIAASSELDIGERGYGLEVIPPSKRASFVKDAHSDVVSDGLRRHVSITASSKNDSFARGDGFYMETNSPISGHAIDVDSLDGHSEYTSAESTPRIGESRRFRGNSQTVPFSSMPDDLYTSLTMLPTDGVLLASGELPRSPLEVERVALRCVSVIEQLPAWQGVPRVVIVDCTGFGYVDMMGIFVLKQVYKELSEIGVKLYFACLKMSVHNVFKSSDIYNFIPRECFFVSVPDAMCECEIHLDGYARVLERQRSIAQSAGKSHPESVSTIPC